MRKQFLLIALVLAMAVWVGGCGTAYSNVRGEDYGNGYFTTIKKWRDFKHGIYRIVYANDTKVMYFVNTSSYRCGITPLYNADGTLQVYKGGE